MFNPKGIAVTIAHINLRDERHGDETVSAADLKCKTTLANSWLDQFAPGLLSSLYKPDPTQDFESADHQPHLRFPMIVMLPLKHEIVGANILIERGSTGDLDIHLECVEVNDFKVTCKEGGSIEVLFRIQLMITPALLANLQDAKEHNPVTMSIEPPIERAEGSPPTTTTSAKPRDPKVTDIFDEPKRAQCLKALQGRGFFALTSEVVDSWTNEQVEQCLTYAKGLDPEGDRSSVGQMLPQCLQDWSNRGGWSGDYKVGETA